MELKQEDIDYIFSLKEEDITRELLIQLFCNTKNSDAKYSPQTRLVIPPKKTIFNNTTNIVTNVGRYITNMFLLYKVADKMEYQNYTLDKKGVGTIQNTLAEKLIVDEITSEIFIDFINKLHWYSFTLISGIVASPSLNLLKANKDVIQRRNELFKKYSKEIESGDIVTAVEIEDELVALAETKLKDDPSMSIFNSGADADLANNYKFYNITKGPVIDNYTKKFSIVKSNLDEGISVEDLPKMGDSVVTGGSARAIQTRSSGYETKKYNSAFQSIALDKEGTDCKSRQTLKVTLTKHNYSWFLFKYFVEGGKIKQLLPDNIKSYIDKTINIRTALFCKNPDTICSVCAGELPYKFNLSKIGLTTTDLSSTFLNASMKAFHDSTLKTTTIDPFKYFE